MRPAGSLLLIAFSLLASFRLIAAADRYLSRSSEWFKTDEAKEICANVLSWQTAQGDWPKNTDTFSVPRPQDAAAARGTFDNGATTGELRFLAKALTATRDEKLSEAFHKGLRLILDAQYPNGGWPQSAAPGTGYGRYITFNDNAFVRLADFVRDVASQPDFGWIDRALRGRCWQAYERAIRCVLQTQVKVNGELTAWCSQHDEVTLEPRPARSYERVSLSGAESVGLLLFLMRAEVPTPEIRVAVNAGLRWFDQAKLSGIRQVRENGERKIVRDPNAPPLWARFYEIGSNRPLFSGRDGVKRYNIEEIEPERRNGYAWYGNWGSALEPARREWQTRVQAYDSTNARLRALGKRGVRLHDPSTILKAGNEFWLFATGRGLPSYRSEDLTSWVEGPHVFTNPPVWVQNTIPQNRGGLDFWAPDIIEMEGRYFLYYSVSSFGKNSSAIALASNATLDPNGPNFRWIDEGVVIQSHATNNFNAIDPAITRDRDGGLWMSFGSFWDGIKLIELDRGTGKRVHPESPVYSLARHESIEAPHIHYRNENYYLFVNWGNCCRGTNSTYNIRVGRGSKITGPYLDRDGNDMANGGGSLLLESEGAFIGPGHAGIIENQGKHWISLHFYDATERGRGVLALRPLRWDDQGWPVASVND